MKIDNLSIDEAAVNVPPAPGQKAEMRFAVGGMSCTACAARAERGLAALDGVLDASVNFALGRADVAFDPARLTGADIARAVEAGGFSVEKAPLAFDIGGMTCASCAGRVEKVLAAVAGVAGAEVNLALERATVKVIDNRVTAAALIAAVEKAGFSATPRFDGAEGRRREQRHEVDVAAAARRELRVFVIAALLSAPLVVHMAAMAAGLGWHLPVWLELGLASIVQFWAGARFYRAGWAALRARSGNMDLLVALGTSAAYLYSAFLVIRAGEAASGSLYFEASMVVITGSSGLALSIRSGPAKVHEPFLPLPFFAVFPIPCWTCRSKARISPSPSSTPISRWNSRTSPGSMW